MELMKGSLNTFLNAFTYPDRTCYPVASCNLQVGPPSSPANRMHLCTHAAMHYVIRLPRGTAHRCQRHVVPAVLPASVRSPAAVG